MDRPEHSNWRRQEDGETVAGIKYSFETNDEPWLDEEHAQSFTTTNPDYVRSDTRCRLKF